MKNKYTKHLSAIASVSILITACSTNTVKINDTGVNINNFTYTGDVLRAPSQNADIKDSETQHIAKQLLDEVNKGDHAVGLAAPQLGNIQARVTIELENPLLTVQTRSILKYPKFWYQPGEEKKSNKLLSYQALY